MTSPRETTVSGARDGDEVDGMRSWWGWGAAEKQIDGDELDGLGQLVRDHLGVEPASPIEPPAPSDVELAPPRVTLPAALADLASVVPRDRLRHAHGQAFRDVARALRGTVPTPPDVVVRPREAADVARLLDWASSNGVACVPYGGGSSVVGGVTPSPEPTVTLDLEHLDTVREIDETSLHAHIGAGAMGPRIEEQLRPHGLTLRHFPQSWEYSTLGGWIATRAGGHYATGWTRIDDFVAAVGAETPSGRLDTRRLPASGAGPSPDRLLLGSEGTFGVITDAWMRVQRRPVFRARASVYFQDLPTGAAAVRGLAQSGLRPANCRLLDATEALLAGLATDGGGAVLLVGFESADHPLGPWIERALELCRDLGGRCPEGPQLSEGDGADGGGGEAGTWRETFLRAPYLRDALARLGMIVETFETAVTWDRFDDLVTTLRRTAREVAVDLCGEAMVATRVTHAYPDGAAPYFTVIAPGGDDPVVRWDAVKAAVSEVIISGGGTITHHHAVGRDHRSGYHRQRPETVGRALAAAKDAFDPAGVLNPGVLL